MLHGVTVRSPVARGRILGSTSTRRSPGTSSRSSPPPTSPAERVALILDDQPYLADDVVNHRRGADRAPRASRQAAARGGAAPRARSRSSRSRRSSRSTSAGADAGDLGRRQRLQDRTWSGKATSTRRSPARRSIVEGEYETGAQEQLYIEPNGMIAVADRTHGVTVWGSMQCPYYVHKALAGLFGLPAEKIRVVQMETGGGFGGKEEYPSIIAGHAALLAWKAGRPVKMIYDRAEDMVATTKRHPSRTRHRTAVDARRTAARDGHRLRRSTAAPTARCRPSCSRAGRSTPPGRTTVRTCACAAARSRPTCRRTARSAASARRRASSRSSGTWTALPRPSACRPRSSAAATSSRRGRRAPSAR